VPARSAPPLTTMALEVELLGPPRIVRDGHAVVPRGRKCWALLAYLLLAERPPARTRLAGLLFPAADDPLAAVRWSLSELRRALGPDVALGGDPVELSLPPTATVDLVRLRTGDPAAIAATAIEHPLLEGAEPDADPSFELWLATTRQQLRGLAASLLHDAALADLAEGRPVAAAAHAARLVRLLPDDRAAHALLRTCTAAPGTEPARQVPRDPAAVAAMLEAADAAFTTGAVPQGLRTLDDAEVAAGGEPALLARVELARGRALVHVGRGGDEDGAAALHRALRLAGRRSAPLVAAAHRELAYADLQRGRYGRVHRRIAAARTRTADPGELGWLDAIDGAAASDAGRHARAEPRLRAAMTHAELAGDRHAALFAAGFLGRLQLLQERDTEATAVLRVAAQEADTWWLAMAPWFGSLLAELELRAGRPDAAAARLERCLALGRQLDDPCLESIATRGLGRALVAAGHVGEGYRRLVAAPVRSRRLPDSYLWIEAYALDALCEAATVHRPAEAPRWIGALETLAGRCGMRELSARALLHRAALGEPGAAGAALAVLDAVDNDRLRRRVTAASASNGGSHATSGRSVTTTAPPAVTARTDPTGGHGHAHHAPGAHRAAP
jgi:hypothetical protein